MGGAAEGRPGRLVVAHLAIDGMRAVHAVRAVFTALGGLPGVRRAEVALGRAVVEHDGTVSEDALAEALRLAGCALTGYREERRRLPLAD